MRYYSPKTGCTYLSGLHAHMPDDVVVISEDIYLLMIANPDPGKVRSHDAEGQPILIAPAPHIPTVNELCQQIEALRLAAYADPVTGSDRFFSEVSRMQAMGEAGWEALRDQGAARYEEIKVEYPWPA